MKVAISNNFWYTTCTPCTKIHNRSSCDCILFIYQLVLAQGHPINARLKKEYLFPVERQGESNSADWKPFFFNLCNPLTPTPPPP